MDWQTFWNDHPAAVAETDFLVQVGHTIDGKPYDAAQFAAMVNQVRNGLDLGADDSLLDLCCGNGIVTRQLALHCRQATGSDFSAVLIERAITHHSAPNLRYRVLDTLALETAKFPDDGAFNRIGMYAALQHFQIHQLTPLLQGMLTHSAQGAIFFIGGILDQRRKDAFLDTAEKRKAYDDYRENGRDRLGTWWQPAELRAAAAGLGLVCEIDDCSSGRPGGHYRFDARLKR